MMCLTGWKGFKLFSKKPKSTLYAPSNIEITPNDKNKYCSACIYYKFEQPHKDKILLFCEHPNRWKSIKVWNWYKSSEMKYQEAPYTANKDNNCEDFKYLRRGYPKKFKDK